LSGSDDTTIRLWETETGRCVRTFEGHTEGVNSVSLSADGCWALSGSKDSTLRLWNVELLTNGKQPLAPPSLCRVASAERASDIQMRFAELLDSARSSAVRGDYATTIRQVRAARELPGYAKAREALELQTIAGRHSVRRRLLGGWCAKTFPGHMDAVNAVSMTRDGLYLFSASQDGTVGMWDLATGQCVRKFSGHAGGIRHIVVTQNGRLLLAATSRGSLRLWKTFDGVRLPTFKGPFGHVRAISLSADDRWVVSGGGEGHLRLWEMSSGRCIKRFARGLGKASTASLSGDGHLALSDGDDRRMHLWGVASGNHIRTFRGSIGILHSVAFSADGRWVLSAGSKGLGLWEVATGECVRSFDGHQGVVSSAVLSPDGGWALSGGFDSSVRLWEVSTGRSVRTFHGHNGRVLSVCLSADCRWALSGSEDKTMRLWELDWEYDFPGWANWDENARRHLDSFLTLHTPFAAKLPHDWRRSNDEIVLALTRSGRPAWNDSDFRALLEDLQYRGYGWLRPEGIRIELEKMAAVWRLASATAVTVHRGSSHEISGRAVMMGDMVLPSDLDVARSRKALALAQELSLTRNPEAAARLNELQRVAKSVICGYALTAEDYRTLMNFVKTSGRDAK
jgi:WD40 repeat protein